MKRPFIFFLVLICTNLVTAQIKIGDNPQTLDPTSLLELESNSKVLVISRMSEVEILALSPLEGAMVYNTDASCIFYYDGTNWNNLCAGGSAGNISWGAISGTLADQTDLAAEFQNYVNLTTTQSIAGEKTLTDRLTVNTGTTTDQVAEFLGRVKGEAGMADEEFVTKAQLDASIGSSGGGTWGSITGDLAVQLDLATEFENYVNLTTDQSIAGEKTLTNKLTVNTGTTTDQVAEFFGRVKGEEGTAPEDFVTKAQLDASGGSGGGAWGSITGTLASQTDLAAEFLNYVNLTSDQSIAGEKTFLTPVKGQDGIAPEDLVTRLQLDAVNATGATGAPGSIFFAGNVNQLTENNANLFWDNNINQLRVGNNLPLLNWSTITNSTLSIQGSVSKPVNFGITQLNETHHTMIINNPAITTTVQIELPDPKICAGRIYIIKKLPAMTMVTNWQYLDTDSVRTNDVLVNVLHLQSNGFEWEQIN